MTVSLVTPVRNIGSGGGPVNPGFPPGQCTYYAWLMRPDIYNISVANGAPVGGQIPGDPYGRYEWDAFNWANLASHYGNFQVGTTPEVGSIMVEAPHPGNPYGHVAYVVQVLSPTDFITHEMNTYGDGDPSLTVYTVHRSVLSGMQFIYQVSVPTVPPPPPTTTPPPPPIPQYGPFTTGCTGSGCLHGIYSQPSWQGSYLGPVYAPVYITCYTTGADYKGDNEYDLLTTGGYVTDYYVILSGQESASQYGIPHC
jgi:surface antigen